MHLELGELLGSLALAGEDTEDVEADGLGEGPALANDDLVTRLDTESGGDVCGEVLVALLVTGVLGDEVKVFTADDQGAWKSQHCPMFQSLPISSSMRVSRSSGRRTVHLGGHDGAGEDTATDGDHAGERALLVDVGALNGGLGGTETQTDVLVPSPGAGVLAGTAGLVVLEDVRLSQRISIRTRGGCRGVVVPASGKRAPTGHCALLASVHNISNLLEIVFSRATYVSSVAILPVAVVG